MSSDGLHQLPSGEIQANPPTRPKARDPEEEVISNARGGVAASVSGDNTSSDSHSEFGVDFLNDIISEYQRSMGIFTVSSTTNGSGIETNSNSSSGGETTNYNEVAQSRRDNTRPSDQTGTRFFLRSHSNMSEESFEPNTSSNSGYDEEEECASDSSDIGSRSSRKRRLSSSLSQHHLREHDQRQEEEQEHQRQRILESEQVEEHPKRKLGEDESSSKRATPKKQKKNHTPHRPDRKDESSSESGMSESGNSGDGSSCFGPEKENSSTGATNTSADEIHLSSLSNSSDCSQEIKSNYTSTSDSDSSQNKAHAVTDHSSERNSGSENQQGPHVDQSSTRFATLSIARNSGKGRRTIEEMSSITTHTEKRDHLAISQPTENKNVEFSAHSGQCGVEECKESRSLEGGICVSNSKNTKHGFAFNEKQPCEHEEKADSEEGQGNRAQQASRVEWVCNFCKTRTVSFEAHCHHASRCYDYMSSSASSSTATSSLPSVVKALAVAPGVASNNELSSETMSSTQGTNGGSESNENGSESSPLT